jgi:hypothetical protein
MQNNSKIVWGNNEMPFNGPLGEQYRTDRAIQYKVTQVISYQSVKLMLSLYLLFEECQGCNDEDLIEYYQTERKITFIIVPGKGKLFQ